MPKKHQSEIQLERSEERFKLLFEHSSVGMTLIDYDTGKFIEVNQTLIDWTGYSKEELLELSFLDITPTKYQKQEEKKRQQLEENGRFDSQEKEYIKKDGSLLPISSEWLFTY